jgi:hypothetical protein
MSPLVRRVVPHRRAPGLPARHRQVPEAAGLPVRGPLEPPMAPGFRSSQPAGWIPAAIPIHIGSTQALTSTNIPRFSRCASLVGGHGVGPFSMTRPASWWGTLGSYCPPTAQTEVVPGTLARPWDHDCRLTGGKDAHSPLLPLDRMRTCPLPRQARDLPARELPQLRRPDQPPEYQRPSCRIASRRSGAPSAIQRPSQAARRVPARAFPVPGRASNGAQT